MKKILAIGLFMSLGVSALAAQAKPYMSELKLKKIVLDNTSEGVQFFQGTSAKA